jgi:hypothetical protein
MRELTDSELLIVTGGLNLNAGRTSDNVIDLRGRDMGGWIDASNMCWAPGTPSSVMYPRGANNFSPPPPPPQSQDGDSPE